MKTVEITESHDIRVSKRRMVAFKPGTKEVSDAHAAKLVDAGVAQIVTPEKPGKPDKAPDPKPGAGGGPATTEHPNTQG